MQGGDDLRHKPAHGGDVIGKRSRQVLQELHIQRASRRTAGGFVNNLVFDLAVGFARQVNPVVRRAFSGVERVMAKKVLNIHARAMNVVGVIA